jgi:hypothetical protein
MTLPSKQALPEEVAAQAESIVNNLLQTDYQHDTEIDPDLGIYDCDCSAFVGWVLNLVAPRHYGSLLEEQGNPQPRPLAYQFYRFLVSLSSSPQEGWVAIPQLADAGRGDIVAWEFPILEAHHDTGHTFIVADSPKLQDDDTFAVRVYDSAAEPHFEDTRGSGETGVGSGFINFQVDDAGSPSAFQFAPGEPFHQFPIAIGRLR